MAARRKQGPARPRAGARIACVAGVAAMALLADTGPAAASSGPPDCAPAAVRAQGLVPTLLGAVAGGLAAPAAPCPAPPRAAAPAPDPTSAAVTQGWGAPAYADEFDGTALRDDWEVYDGPGHAGNGRRTPKAVSVRDGVLTITGSPRGDTAGMAWGKGRRYGRWEGRVKAPASDESYNALLLLWPDAENFPEGGEIDFMEMMDHTRQETHVFLHYGKDNRQVSGKVRADATQWHNWAVEWTPTHIATFLDGKEWWRTERTDIFPPDRMHLCVQLDWFPDSGRGAVQESTMQVDWVRQYTVGGSATGDARPGRAAADTPHGSAQRAQSGAGA
jgi:glycosyl hydrolase family 16